MSKIINLLDRLERVKLAREMEPEPDGLSLSLMALGREMASMTEDDIAALAAETDEDGRQILTLEQARAFVASFAR